MQVLVLLENRRQYHHPSLRIFFICTLSIFTKGSSNRTRDGSVGDGLDAGRRNSGRLGQVLGLLPLGHPLQPVSLDVLLHVVPEIWLGLMLKTFFKPNRKYCRLLRLRI